MRPIINVPEEDWATDIDSMHKKFGKDRACDSEDILVDRQTHRQTYSTQYFAAAPRGEVINFQVTVMFLFLILFCYARKYDVQFLG